jgi:hypothetical protein
MCSTTTHLDITANLPTLQLLPPIFPQFLPVGVAANASLSKYGIPQNPITTNGLSTAKAKQMEAFPTICIPFSITLLQENTYENIQSGYK